MFYATDDGAFLVDAEGNCTAIGINAKDKVVEVRELESISIVRGEGGQLPAGAVPATIDEIVARFNVSEANPLKPAAIAPEAEEAPEAPSDGSVDPEAHTKAELEAMAAEMGIEVPSKATKAEIAAIINEA